MVTSSSSSSGGGGITVTSRFFLIQHPIFLPGKAEIGSVRCESRSLDVICIHPRWSDFPRMLHRE